MPARLEPGLVVCRRSPLFESAGDLPDNNPDNPGAGYLPITKERIEREEWGVTARFPVSFPHVQYVSFGCYKDWFSLADGLGCGYEQAGCGREFYLEPGFDSSREFADHCSDPEIASVWLYTLW